MVFDKRDECFRNGDGSISCYRDGFWYTDKGIIIKWVIFACFFGFFMLWFVGGYIHAKRRIKKGLPLLAYHRWLVPRRHYNPQPQNHFTFYSPQHQHPYGPPPQQRPDGTWPQPPPTYAHDAPPSYYAPPGGNPNGAAKMYPGGAPQGMEMPQYGVPPPPGPPPAQQQQSGVVGGSSSQQQGGQQQWQGGDVEAGQLPERPANAKTRVAGLMDRFRR
ncbi:hypothetical protein BU24DRAFT_236978 [Aaosphaeria arxii CBS 175.79]|uniref:Uncharacterized protein n=1 Tax=Aaosphaeria arxii CBS 175.79 TaxID=1450172 RepID=A0A6A5XKK5_9PLEO|nr:uncharacterized protein BU24DRAFT_236978 [Aaosphaeria arxii CBS 175.79]KAF2013406.1 hypothetical protein BU24DRAFT_236978 [Aaosphaeria arxii CBS 175.79]